MVYHYSQVRSEARKVHDLFFDILKIAFPDTDFREARSALSFSGQISASTVTSTRQVAGSQSKRHRMTNEVETDPSPSQKPLQRGSASSGENTRIKVHIPPKESRAGSVGGSSRDQLQQEDSPRLTHPGELVVCKKRRNDRDKSSMKSKAGSAGPVSPPSMGPPVRSPAPGSVPKDARLAIGQPSQQPNGSGGSVGWANPVKRLRTDSGKRRPSHL